ncbi:hypothetical protein SDC9_78618 [bioreactor metagenome]|uniref:Uncharacterized protein n=1 Tax=bioreactor metagenome TaxID=1076179 RepID=A0A644YTZ4_9ZZZZ
MVSPSQYGPVFPAEAEGRGFTVTFTEDVVELNPSETVTVYVADAAGVIVGLSSVDENPAGFEDHEYVYEPDPPDARAVIVTLFPAHTDPAVVCAFTDKAPPLTLTVICDVEVQPVT